MPTRLDRFTGGIVRPTTTPTGPTTITPTVRPDVLNPGVVVRPTKPLPPPTPDISLRPTGGRAPTTMDLVIKRTFDGLTPEAAANTIKSKLQGTVAPQNQKLVDDTVNARVRDMQAAFNNVFTPGTPHNQFLASKLPAKIHVIGSLSSSNPVVYEVTKPGEQPRYFTRGWSGGFAELSKPPVQVVMRGEVTLEPRGLRMDYPAWKNNALAGQITTITEL
jgi:hypothetical protein